MEYEEIKLPNGMIRWQPIGVEKPRNLTPVEKIALDKKTELLTAKAEHRQETCWSCGERKASIWVHEVGFDFKGDKAHAGQHIAISSSDYTGPVPGFCNLCLGFGPRDLAERVYFDRPEMYWGVRPNRWFVIFTDGTRQGDMIISIDPKQELPTIIEEFISGNND